MLWHECLAHLLSVKRRKNRLMKSLHCGSICLRVFRIPNSEEMLGFYEIYYENFAPRGHTKVAHFIFYYHEQNGGRTTW